MGGGLLQIAANSAIDPVFNDPNYTLFKAVYHKYTPFSIQDYTLKLSSMSDFGKKMEITIPKVGDLLTDAVLVVDLPQIQGEYTFTNQSEYLNSLTSQYTFSTMNDIQQYNENLYKLDLGNNISAYLVRDSQINKYQLMLPLLDATMFLTQGKTQKFSLDSFLQKNKQFFDNQYNLHVIQNLTYAINSTITNIDYLNYAFQDKEFYFFIANLLNIKQIDPTYSIKYYNDWENEYYKTVKKYILKRPEVVALNTFIENMNTEITNSVKINDYVFNYSSIFSLSPFENQYNIILPISFTNTFYLTYKPFESVTNNKNYLIDSTVSFFSIFNKRYILVKRNNEIIGAVNIIQINDTDPINLIVKPFRHIYTNNLLNNNSYPLFIYYGFNTLQFEPINFAIISTYKLNINKYHEFTLDRSIQISVGSIIIIGINSSQLPSNNYNQIYGIFKIIQVRKSFTTIDQFTETNYNTILTAQPIEIDQLLSTDTLLISSNTNITSNTYYNNYNNNVANTMTKDDLINLIKQTIYTDVTISTLITTPIVSISEYLLRQSVFESDFVLTPSVITTLQSNIQTYLIDSYDVLFNYLTKIYNKTIIKSSTNQDYLNNIYYKVNYQQTSNIFNFIGAGTTTFANLVNGVFRYKQYIQNIINSQISSEDQYVTLLSYTNFLTTYIINQYQTLSVGFNNEWSASLLNISGNLSDTFIKIINYVQAGNTSGRQTLIKFITNSFTASKSSITNLTITYKKRDVSLNTISNYYYVTYTIPLNLVVNMSTNYIVLDHTNLCLSIKSAFNLQNIDLSSMTFNYIDNNNNNVKLNVINLTTYLDNYSNDLISVINNNTNITTQLYGNNILLDYLNVQNDTMFGLMKNYEISRENIIRNGGTKYAIYHEDDMDKNPLLVDNTFMITFLSDQYYPRFVISKQMQLYQNIYQKTYELSQNYATEPSSIFFMNNLNYERTDGYNYLNNSQGSIQFLDPLQFPTIINSSEYAYTLLDKVSKAGIIITPQTFSFIHYLEDLEEHTISSQKSYLELYWNTIFAQSGETTENINNYFAALASKDDALLIYYCYKYMTELLCYLSEAYNLQTYSGNLDDTYFKTIYQMSPQVLGTTFFNAFLSLMKITEFSSSPIDNFYKQYNSIIQGSQTLYDYFNNFETNPDYIINNNVQFNNEMNNLIQEMSYVFQVVTRLTKKHNINITLTNGLSLSNYPCVYKIHGSGKLVKIVLVSDQYRIINAVNSVFNSSMAFPTNYYVDDYYKIFNLSLHYDYLKYTFFAGYGGILRDIQYPLKTLSNFYKKINNYITANVNDVDFAFFYANQTQTYLPNMEGYIIQTYQGWIQRNTQPYFYYYNTLSSFYDMMYIYSGRSFISEYYSKKSNNTFYNNRPDTIRGITIYSTRMAYGTRDFISRYNGVSKRYNLLDQRLFGIDNNFKQSTVLNYNTIQDPIQIMQLLTILNQRFTDYQEFLVLMKNSINVTGSYIQNSSTDNYAILITQFKVNSVSMTDLDIFNGWNSYISNYYLNNDYNFSSLISGLSNTISLYNELNVSTLDYSSLGYELYNFINNFNAINQRNFADKNLLRYENGTLYHNLVNELNQTLSGLTNFSDKNNLSNDINYRNTNYSLVSLDFLNISLANIVGPYQSDVSTFKQLFTSILNYRQKNVSTTAQSINEAKLYDDYYSINDVTSLTFYDKFFKFNSNIDYNLIPLIYHDLYNIQNASHTVVFYLNYLYSFLNNTSSKPNIADFDDDTLPISYYFPKYLSSGIDYFLSNFHQLKFDSLAFYPYKSVPANITQYDGTIISRPKSFMYVFLLMKIQYRNYYYSNVDNAYLYVNRTSYNGNPVRNIIGLNTYNNYTDIKSDVAAFDTLIDGVAVNGAIDHLQNIIHPFFVNKHVDNLLFVKDLLTDLLTVPDEASLYTILGNNDNYITFLNEKTIVTNAFDNTGLIFGQYPYTLGVLSDYNTMGYIPIIDSTGTSINVYIEGNIVLPSLITKIYYFLISECFILNQTELIGSSFQTTPMSLGNILGQITAKDWKNGLINLISEYLFLLLKSKKIIYQNSIYEISFNDIYTRLKVNTNADAINDLINMYINSILKITLTSFTVQSGNNSTTLTSYLGEYEQFKIPNVFSLITIKKNFNYSGYYRLIFALRQSLIGVYNNFEERVQFHNAFDYWKVNNRILISDYTVITFNNNNYMIRKSEQSSITSGLVYYNTNKTNIPPNLFTTIIDYIISNVQNSINGGSSKYGYFTKYDFKNFVYIKNGYDVTLTLYNVFFTNINELYDISINTGSKTITGTPTSGSLGLPFSISYKILPFGYYYDFINDTLQYQQLLYQNDITYVFQNMFTLFKNFQDINSSLSLLASYSEPFSPSSNISHYEFIYFPTFIESFIYYDFTSKTDPTKQVNAVILPTTAKLKVNTLFNLIFTNWSEFYGVYYYVYLGTSPTAANLLGTGVTQFINGTYVGSLYIQFNVAGKQFVSITNALIDDTHPFGSSSVAVNIITPITVSSISDGTLDNTYAIRTIPRSFLIGLTDWQTSIGITELYTFFSLTSDGNNLTNAAGVPELADGPFNIEAFIPPGNSDFSFRINTVVGFAESESLYVYVSDKGNTADFNSAQVFALIPNITKAKTINIANDIEDQSKVGQLDNYTGLLTVPKTYTIILPFWSSDYRISELYVYFADNISGTNLGNDIKQSNIPQARVTLIKTDAYYYATFIAGFKNLGNNYVYLTYNQISQSSPYGSLPINFLLNPTNPIVTTRIENVTGILSQYISIINQQTTFTITLGNWLNTYTSQNITQLYIYIKNIFEPNVYTSYVALNNLPNQKYEIVNNNGVYQVTFTTTFTSITQLYVYLTFNQITNMYNYGEGLVNIQITNPPGDLVNFNYIDVINPFNTDYIAKTLTTFETNNIVIKVNNFSPNYNIYLTVPNQLYIFLASANNPTTIYSNPIAIIFDENFNLNYSLYTQSINPVYIFISDTITFGTGLIAYSAGSLNNIIGPVNGILNIPTFVINNKARQFNISLTNWDSSYGIVRNITELNVYIGPNINTPIVNFGSFPITKPNNYIVNFVYELEAPSSTYNVFIQDSNNNLKQQITNQLYVSDPVFINTLIPNTIPVPTFTQVSYTGSLGNWNTLFPSQLYLFTGLTIDATTPVNTTVTINQNGNFSFTTQVTQFPFTNFAFSDAPIFTTGYIETVYFQIPTIIGPINAYFNNQSYVITTKPTNYSILLQNWDPTYSFSSVYAYIKNNNNLLLNFGPQTVSLVNGVYYLLFTAIVDSSVSTGPYTITISDTNYNVSGYNFLQTLTTPLTIILQIVLDHIDVDPLPFATYTLSTFTGYINNWIADIFPAQLYIDYFNTFDNSYNSDTVTVNNLGIFTYVQTITSYPSIIVGISDNTVYGNGYLETQQLILTNIIGPVNANLTTNPYAIINLTTTYNIILTNWNTSYSSINNLYIYLGSDINTLVHSFGIQTIQFDDTNYYINFTASVSAINQGSYNLYLSNQNPNNIITTPLVKQFISTFNIANQIAITNITTNPTPFATYTSTTFNGQLSNWFPNLYISTLNIFYTTYDSNLIVDQVTINSNGTFSYVNTNNTLPSITISLSDSTTYESGYIKSNIYTVNSIIGPVNANLTTEPYTLLGTNKTYNIILTNWNTSYSSINNLYIYLGTNIDTAVYTYGLKTIQFDGTNYFINYIGVVSNITQGSYNLYLSEQDPANIINPPLVKQFISLFTVSGQITITNITTDPTPFATYASTTFNGQLTSWFPLTYPSTLNIFYITKYDNILTTDTVSINSNGTFSYTNTNNTLPSITIALSDSSTYGEGYIESNIYTVNVIAGPVSPVLTTNPYAIFTKSTDYNIELTQWNESYPTSMYVYLGSNINTVIYSYGIKTVNFDGTNYTITFSATLPVIVQNQYNLYMSDQNPTNIITRRLVNQFINTFNVANNINISNITPNPIQTYSEITYNGQLTNWFSNLYPSTLNLFYTISYDSTLTVTPVTINSNGTFTYVDYNDTLPSVTIALSDSTTYGDNSGYIKSNIYTLNAIISSINATISVSKIIQNKTLSTRVLLPNWNSSYNITSLYIYIGTNPNTLIESYGLQTIFLDTDNVYKMTFNITPTTAPGSYQLYLSNTTPSTISYLARELITPNLTILNQIQIASITPTTFFTYQNTVFNGIINYWDSSFYNKTMYVVYYSSYDNIYYNQQVTISTGGIFSFTFMENYIADFNIIITDNVNLANSYIKSEVYTITSSNIKIGYTNTAFNNTYVIPNVSTTLNFRLNNWNSSYSLTQLYIYIGSNINTPIVSFGSKTITNTNNVYTISFSTTITLNINTYTLYLCNSDPTIVPFPAFLINEPINNQLNLINQIEVGSLTTIPSPVSTYTSANYSGTISNWVSSLFNPRLNIFIADNYVDFITINNSGNFNFTSSSSIKYNTDTIKFSDNATYSSGYLKTPPFNFTTIIGNINGTVTPFAYPKNIIVSFTITLTNWNSSYNISTLYIFSATNTNFTNLTSITSGTVNNTNNIYTVTFNASFTGNGPYYFVISDIQNPTNNLYKIFQTINVPLYYFELNFTPIELRTPSIISNPNNISNLFMWFDANEIVGTYLNQPANNSNLTSWVNKTGMSVYNLSSVNGNAKFITNGVSNLNSIYLNNNGLRANVPANSFSNGLSVFIVYKNTGSTTSTVSLFNRNLVADNTPYPINVYNASRDFANNTGQLINSITSPFNISVVTTSTIFYFNTDSTLQYNEHANGTLNIDSDTSYFTDTGTQIRIGIDSANTTGTTGFIGNISEILIYNRTLTSTEQRTVEGYLAWKWNLVTSLPSTHPYSYLNPSFTIPVNTFIGFITPYQIVLSTYTPIQGLTSFYIRYNTNIVSQTNLVLIGNATIIQDENSNYVLRFNVQFPSANTYYLYLTDIAGNIYKSISTPILVTDGSSLITLSTPTSTVNQNTLITVTLGGWSSVIDLTQVDIYYSTISNDPTPILLTTTNVQYTFNYYYVTFLAIPSGNLYFYIIGKKNNITLINKSINITVNVISVLTPYLNKNTNYILDPTSISGLTVWLDANTVSGSYLNQPNNNTGVSTWVDKSGNNYNATPAEGTPTFVTSGINGFPSVKLSTGNNYVCEVPTGTFDAGMTIFIVYKSVGTPSAYETLITRNEVNVPNPFDMYNDIRDIGDGVDQDSIESPVNINGNTTPSIFYANMDANNSIYLESNQFINIANFSINYWDDSLNEDQLFIGTRADLFTQFNGYISEVLIFNKSLSKLEQYKIEGYLAYKWKFEIYLPLYHPFSPIQSSVFTPLLFDSLQLWMDASNTSSYTLVDGNVTQWRDSSYLKNIANTNVDFNPVVTGIKNNLTTMVFNSSTMRIVNPNILANDPNVTLMFLIYLPEGVSSSSPFGNESNPELFPFTDGNIYTSFGISYLNIGPVPSGWVIYTVVTSVTSNTTKFYINGVIIRTSTFNNTYINNTDGWTIGCDNDDAPAMTSTLAEMLVFNSSLSRDQQILMEGYLANKWGVNNLLPNTSPYLTNSPTLLDYNNLLYGNLKLNLDASDIDNFTFDNNNILTWIDTSNNNNSLTSAYSNPILQINPITEKIGVYFNYASMIPTSVNKMVLNNDNQFSIFTIGYINNTDSNTNPTILSTNNNNSTSYTFNIRKNTSFINQINVTYPNGAGGVLYQLYGNLSSNLSNGLHNMNYNQSTNGSVFINGSSIQTLGTPLTNLFSSNFYLGGIQSNTNSFLQNSYIHQVLIYNKKLDELSRYIIEGQLAAKWNVTTSNSLGSLGQINTYMGINTLFTILLENWRLTSVSNIYVGYNTDPNSLTDLNIIGSFPINQLNNMYYTSLNNIFGTSDTYYMHLVDENDVEYTNISKPIVVQDLSTIIQTDTAITLVQNQTYNLELKNWKSIIDSIGLYSNQIKNFNLSIGQSSTDPSPVFVANLTINYTSNIYILTIPGLTNVNNKYIFLSSTINGVVVRIPPILITMININLSINYDYGLLNTPTNYTITINNVSNFYQLYPNIYLYWATLPDLTSGLNIIGQKSLTSNQFTFQYNSTQSTIYFYISTGSNYTGITSFIGPINFVDPNTLSITLDTYENNTNTRNILLGGWSFEFNSVLNLSIFNNNTLINTSSIIAFTPNSISGVQTWLDGSLESNFILNTNRIVQWKDSSSNNNNATTVNQKYPIYDPVNKGVNFVGNNLLYLPDGTIPYNNDNYHIFIVLTPSDTATNTGFILSSFDQYPPSSNSANSFLIDNNIYIQSCNNDDDLSSSAYTDDIKQIVSFEYISGVNRTTYINGVSSGNDNPPPRESTQFNNVIGGIPDISTFSNLIHEIIIYKNALTLNERQKIETYLSNKWSIQLP